MTRQTIFSPCRRYRYTLWREWGELIFLEDPHLDYHLGRSDQYVQFIGLNPSTADETQDDPTVRRCIDFAKRWGFGALCMTNAFAWRDTDPKAMKQADWPEGEMRPSVHPLASVWDMDVKTFIDWNIYFLLKSARGAGLVVAAWGTHGKHVARHWTLISELERVGIDLHCLGVNADGTPKHPLYLAKNLLPVPFRPNETKRNDVPQQQTEEAEGSMVPGAPRGCSTQKAVPENPARE